MTRPHQLDLVDLVARGVDTPRDARGTGMESVSGATPDDVAERRPRGNGACVAAAAATITVTSQAGETSPCLRRPSRREPRRSVRIRISADVYARVPACRPWTKDRPPDQPNGGRGDQGEGPGPLRVLVAGGASVA